MRPLWLLIGVVSCDLAESPGTSTAIGTIGGCESNPALCNNSPEYLHDGMHELSLFGSPNPQNYRPDLDPTTMLPRVWKAGVPYQLDVRDGELMGLAPSGAFGFRDDGAVGAEIRMVNATTGLRVFDLVVMGHRPAVYTIGPGSTHFYRMNWRPPGTSYPKNNACNPYTWPDPRRAPLLGMEDGEVLMFTGDRFFPQTFTLASTAEAAAGWVTFGCAGHTLAKLDLTGNTRHRDPDDWAGHQATLKLYAANYCGNGTPAHPRKLWTQPGTPLLWKGPTTEYADTPSGIEARWDAHGATCIGVPRLTAHGIESVDLITQILNDPDCVALNVHDCANTNVDYLANRPRISANYFPM